MDDVNLSDSARQALLSPNNELHFSTASMWEISIKLSLGKLQLSENWSSLLLQELSVNQIQRLPITDEHCIQLVELPFHHRDPFDRMLIAQSLVEDMVLLTRDRNIRRYKLETLW